LNVLGAILESREQLDEAEAAYREALKIRTARLPPEHPDLATSKAHLGALLKATGNLAEAEPLLQSALDIREKKLGPRHPDTVKSLDTLGDLMRRSGHPDRARELFRRADRYRRSSVQQIRILFGTNRQEETSGNAGLQFGRVEGGNQALTVGIAEVLVPDVRAGARAASARAQVGLNASERAQPEDVTSADHMNIREIWKSSPRELVAVARNELQQSQLYSGKTLLFLHGFNTSFNNALLRAAQLAYDLKFDGPVLVFSWPSKGGDTWWDHIKNIFNYTSDRISAANARIPFAQFLNQVVLPAGPQSIELLAHSMGNRLLLETLSDAARTPQDGIGPVIGGLILAAPDVPHTEFETFMNELRETGTLKTLYAARNDRALKASRDFWGEAPAGLIEDPPSWWQFWKSASTPEPIVVPSVETIDVSDVGLNFLNLNHDLYATNTLLVEDMRSVIQDSLHPPHQRNVHLFLRKAGAAGDYWVLRIKAN
jgi:esterase/lipase superfamily enzyme